jgi:hypothetical protein
MPEPCPTNPGPAPDLLGALAAAAAAIARLDQALAGHPLLPALLYRARLEAVRRQAATDGQYIDPWHLAAVLEGLRLRMDHALRIIDRGMILDAARHALVLHQWLAEPDGAQNMEIQRAERVLAEASVGAPPLLTAALGFHAWLADGDGRRAPMRSALTRHWMKTGLLRAPVPLTGAAALNPETGWNRAIWVPAFLWAVADEAANALQLLLDLERAWLTARRAVAGRRRTSRASAAVDLLAAAPLLSATTLAHGLGMAIKNATALLEDFRAADIAVEVTHRSARRLYALAGLAPLRDQVAPPRRPIPGRGRGRPRLLPPDEAVPQPDPMPPTPLTPLERRQFDYSDIDVAMALADATIRQARRRLEALARLPSTSNDERSRPSELEPMAAAPVDSAPAPQD